MYGLKLHLQQSGKNKVQYRFTMVGRTTIMSRPLTEVSRVFLSVFHLEVEIQVVTLETTGNLHSSSLLAVQTTY